MRRQKRKIDERLSYEPGAFWIAPGEDIPTAQRRAWMKPTELTAWKAAKTARARDNVERRALAAMVKERDADAVVRKARIDAATAGAAAERERRAARIVQMEDVDIQNNLRRARAARRNGQKGGKPTVPGMAEAVAAVCELLQTARDNGAKPNVKRACLKICKEKTLPVKWTALRKHVLKKWTKR